MPLQTVHTSFTFGFNKSKLGSIETGVKRATTNLKAITANADVFQQKMGSFFQRAKGVIGAYLGFRAIRSITTDYAKGADAIAKFSAGLGINAQQYQRLTYAAGLNGVSVKEINAALPTLARNSANAAGGSKKMFLAFRAANTEFKDGEGKIKKPITLLTDLSDGLKKVQSDSKRAQILTTIFGASGKKMGVLMAQGSEGIKKAMAEADKFGNVLSNKQLKAAENFNDEMQRVKTIMLGLRNMIASKVLPVITAQLRAFQMWWREGKNAERALKALKLVAFFTAIVMGRIITGMIIRQVKVFTQGIWAMVRGLTAANRAASLLAIKVTAIFLAIILVILVIDDLVAFAQGRDSLIGRILGDSQLAKDLKDSLIEMAQAAKDAWGEIAPALLAVWEALKPALKELWKAIEPLIGPVFRAAVWGMVFSFQGLAMAIRIVTDLFKFQTKSWAGFAIVAGVVLKVLKFIGKTLVDITHAASTAANALAAVTGAQQIESGINEGLEKFSKVGNRVKGTFDSTGRQVTTGLFRSGPEMAFAGGPRTGPLPSAFTSRPGASRFTNNSTVNAVPGAIQVTVNGGGDPAAIALALNAALPPAFNKMITAASRDLVKPPTGQR